MSAIKLKENLWSVGVLNPGLRVFDIIMEARYGTSYNAFLLTGEKNVLIETVHADYFDEYLANIESVIPISQIDYLIMNHTEPDHSGAVALLLEKNPGITVVCTMAAQKYLSAITNSSFACQVVKDGDTLELGGGALKFIVAPLLHWPDSMFTWDEAGGTLFTCDFLGCHFCAPTMLDSDLHHPAAYTREYRYYFECIFGPFKPYVLAGLGKIQGLGATLICPSHGPCLTESIAARVEDYRAWATPVPRERPLAAVLYASAYGCTGQLAQAAGEALRENKALEVSVVDVVTTPLAEAAECINEAAAVLVGSCTINRDAPKVIWDLLASVDAITTRQKPAAVFGSFGWSGEAVPMMKTRMEQLKFKLAGDGLRVNFTPNEDDLAAMRALALEVAAQIK